MTNNHLPTLYYVHDPMCSWCWGFRPQWLKLKQALPETIQIISLVGGLAPDSDQPMAESLRQDIQSAWLRIQQVIPGTQFNFDFWTENTPKRSTYPACRAVITAGLLADKGQQMTYGIQQAYYLNAKNPSDLETLLDVSMSIGLNADEFESLMLSSELQSAFTTQLQQVRAIGVHSFPSLVLQLGPKLHAVQLDYNSAHNMLAEITLMANQSS